MNLVTCTVKEFKKVEGEFYQLDVNVLGQDYQYFVFEFRNKLFLIEEKSSRFSKRVKHGLADFLETQESVEYAFDLLKQKTNIHIYV